MAKLRRHEEKLPTGLVSVWIFSLCLLAVAARNFEQGGIGTDGPLYALLARGVARTGEWFYLRGTVEKFIPSADFPHLSIWLMALIFKVLPAADWSARILGMFYYGGFLAIFFRFLRRFAGLQVATVAVLLLWSFYRFSNYFANVTLDPGALFFGVAAIFLAYESVWDRRRDLAVLGGSCLALCAMTKGLMVLGFLPAWLFAIALAGWPTRFRGAPPILGLIFASAVGVLALYLLSVHLAVPGLIDRYFANQWWNRFRVQWDWSLLFRTRFWFPLVHATHWLAFVALASLFWKRPHGIHWLPWILIATFAGLYAPADRVGIHYLVAFLPWFAWILSYAFFPRGKWSVAMVMQVSAAFSLLMLVILQFFPIRVHGPEDREVPHLQARIRDGRVQRLVLDDRPESINFTYKDRYTWYLDIPIQTVSLGEEVPAPTPKTAYLAYHRDAAREKEIVQRGWCIDERFTTRTVFIDCPRFAP